MSKPDFVEALDLHAEGLQGGLDLAPVLLAHTTPEDQRLKGLLSLAAQVKSTLVPVEPRPGFVTDLKARLLANASQARKVKAIRHPSATLHPAILRQAAPREVRGAGDAGQVTREQERQVILGVLAGVGGLLYAAGLALLGLRMMFAMVTLVVALLGWWLTRPALTRSRRTR